MSDYLEGLRVGKIEGFKIATERLSGDSWERFAIRHIPTGKYLPERWRKGRGYSHDEPSYDFPRLFPSERSAKAALRAWLQGEWKEYVYTGDWGTLESGGSEPVEVKGRNRDEMEIVRFRITRA